MNTRLIFTLESSGSAMRIGRADGEARCVAGQLCLIHYTATQYSFLARYATINSTCSVIFAANRILINQVLPSTVTPALSVCLSLPLSLFLYTSTLVIVANFLLVRILLKAEEFHVSSGSRSGVADTRHRDTTGQEMDRQCIKLVAIV